MRPTLRYSIPLPTLNHPDSGMPRANNSMSLPDFPESSSMAADSFSKEIFSKQISDSVTICSTSSVADITALPDVVEEKKNHPLDLPPQDRGRGAWSFLLGICMLESTYFGFPMAFGVFQSYYSSLPKFHNNKNIPTIGALAISLIHIGILVANLFALRFPHLLRHMVVFGTLGAMLSLILASFATQVWHLVLTQGFLYGFLWSFGYAPFLILIQDWFNLRRGLANGILLASSGISGLFLPFVLEISLKRFSFRTTLRAFVVLSVLSALPAFFLVKPRTPVGHPMHFSSSPKPSAENPGQRSRSKYAAIRNPCVHVFALAVFAQGLAFFLPNTFLPSYSGALRLSPKTGDLLLAATNLAQVAGQLLLGHLTDKIHPHIPVAGATFISGIGALLLWGLAKSLAPLVVLSCVWGFFALSYSTLWFRAIEHVTGTAEETFAGYGACSFMRGVALLLEGPIASRLLEAEVVKGEYGIGMYKRLIVFTGVMLLVSSLIDATLLSKRGSKSKENDGENCGTNAGEEM